METASTLSEAAREFDRVLEDYPNCLYVEDSAFRRAVCDYGLGAFDAAVERLSRFVSAYPQSRLRGEALMMRADARGALGVLSEAVGDYQAAMEDSALNAELYNHCAFQCGRILAARAVISDASSTPV